MYFLIEKQMLKICAAFCFVIPDYIAKVDFCKHFNLIMQLLIAFSRECTCASLRGADQGQFAFQN